MEIYTSIIALVVVLVIVWLVWTMVKKFESPSKSRSGPLPTNGQSLDLSQGLTNAHCEALNAALGGVILSKPENATSGGVCTIMQDMSSKMGKLTINGQTSNSPLANAALFSTEISNGKTLNLYEIMVPDEPDAKTGVSKVQNYITNLATSGLGVAGVHFHWLNTNPHVIAVHHQDTGSDPLQFVQKTMGSLQNAGFPV